MASSDLSSLGFSRSLELIMFFSHNKSANGTFCHGLSAKQTRRRSLVPPPGFLKVQ